MKVLGKHESASRGTVYSGQNRKIMKATKRKTKISNTDM